MWGVWKGLTALIQIVSLYRELKWKIGFEKCLEFVKWAPSRLLLSLVQLPMSCLRSWVGILREVGHRSVLIMGLARSWLSMFFFCQICIIRFPETNFCTTWRKSFLQVLFKAFCVAAFLIKLPYMFRRKARYISK